MYNFAEEEGKYRVIYTDDKQHYLMLWECVTDGNLLREFADKYGLLIEGEENLTTDVGSGRYIVYETPSKENFLLGSGPLIRRLAPFKAFDYLYPYFYRNNKHNLLVCDAVYLCKKGAGPNPFKVYDEKKYGPLTQMELPHAE